MTLSIFDKLYKIDIVIPLSERYHPYRIVYDIETDLNKDSAATTNAPKLNFLGQHKLFGINVCSNVVGYKIPQCFVSEGDP